MDSAHILRPAQPHDIPAMMFLFRASVHQVADADYDQAQRDAWAPDSGDPTRWEKRFAEQQVWVAETKGKLSGFCAWTLDGYLDLLYVDPEYVRLGVATALYDQAENDLRTRSVQRVHTQASLTAQPFFRRHGFRFINQQIVRVRGANIPNAVMEKFLE